MSKLNFLLFLQTYADANSTNAPNLSHLRWTRDLNGLAVDKPLSQEFNLAPGESKTIFDGSRTLNHDNTTEYSIALKPLTTNTYILSHASGTAPDFRTPRTTGADATTQVTVTKNGPLTIFTAVAGTLFDLVSGGVAVGDSVRIGDDFNVANQGDYKVLARTATSFTVENELGVPEGPITLGSGFADQVQIFSAAGVQVGDVLKITGGFSQVSRQSFKVTRVAAEELEFYSTEVLPEESGVLTNALAVYSEAKQLVYVEANQKVSMILNGVSGNEVEPFIQGSSSQPGIFLRKSTIWSLVVANDGLDVAKVYVAAVE